MIFNFNFIRISNLHKFKNKNFNQFLRENIIWRIINISDYWGISDALVASSISLVSFLFWFEILLIILLFFKFSHCVSCIRVESLKMFHMEVFNWINIDLSSKRSKLNKSWKDYFDCLKRILILFLIQLIKISTGENWGV